MTEPEKKPAEEPGEEPDAGTAARFTRQPTAPKDLTRPQESFPRNSRSSCISPGTLLCPLCGSRDVSLYLQERISSYHACSRCSLVFLDPKDRLPPEAEEARYRSHQNAPEHPGYREFLGRLLTVLVPMLPAGAEGLDFGSGPGPVLAMMLREEGFPMELYDPFFAPEPAALQRTYDFITATEVFEHLHNPGQDISLLFSLLRPGGSLGIMTNLFEESRDFGSWYYRKDPTHVCFYSRAAFGWIADRFGCGIELYGNSVIILTL